MFVFLVNRARRGFSLKIASKMHFVAVIFIVHLCISATIVQARNVDNIDDNMKMTQNRTASTIADVVETNIKNVNNFNNNNVNCDKVKPFFDMRNISVHHGHQSNGKICEGQCCGDREEATLRMQVQQDFASLLRHNSRSLQGLLATTATTLHDHMIELASQSENKTLHLFSQVYKRMAVLSRDPIKSLYADIKRYMSIPEGDATFAANNLDIKLSVHRFFTELFPLVYHNAINLQTRDFSHEYKTCLRDAIAELQPFGDIPRQISVAAFKSLEATRVLLQAFTVGVEILNATDTLLTSDQNGGGASDSCHQALLRMTYCPKCRGLSTRTKPCSGYCLNVLRGCLTQHVTELDSPWNDYVEAIERLVIAIKQHDVGVNADDVIRTLDTKISEAIMYAMENGPVIENKVKVACGRAKLSEKEDPLMAELVDDRTMGSNKPQRISSSLRTTPPDTQLLHFLASVVKSRGFYATLADSLCKDESFAETRDGRECWNGQRIGEYTETVVDASLSMQKYNPEVRPLATIPSGGPQVARLADKLRHVRQVVISALGSAGLPESDSYMQGDAAEGSGSGQQGSPRYNDDSDDGAYEGSGSGDHDVNHHVSIESGDKTASKTPMNSPPNVQQASGSMTLLHSSGLLLAAILTSVRYLLVKN